jgi:hypothetical protein
MENLVQFLTVSADALSGHVSVLFTSVTDWNMLLSIGGVLTLALALGVATYSDIPAEVLANIRRWHGSIDEQFDNIGNLVNVLDANAVPWSVPSDLLFSLKENRATLAVLIPRCRSNYGSPADRTTRNVLLKSTVGLCLTQAKAWAYTQYYAGVLTIENVHLLGFLLPGEAGGRRDRTIPVDVLAEVKVSIINADFIRVVIDQASDDNAALVVHGWPQGVRQALIVILAADGVTEVVRQMTTHLHNRIQMPEGSHGKQFIIKAAFLRHIDDTPVFGPEPTFSMPLNTEDLAATLDRQHHEEFEAQMREVEHHRQEIERLHDGQANAT